MTNDDLDALAQRWEGAAGNYRLLKFEDAHKDVLALLAEVRRLSQSVPALEARAKNGELRYRNLSQSLLADVEALVLKHAWGET